MRRAVFVILSFAILANPALASVDSISAEGTPAFEKRLEEMRARVLEKIQAAIVGTLEQELPASSEISMQPAPDPFSVNRPEVAAFLSYFRNSSRIGLALRRLASYESSVRRILREEQVPEELVYLPVVESLYDPQAVRQLVPEGGRSWPRPARAMGSAKRAVSMNGSTSKDRRGPQRATWVISTGCLAIGCWRWRLITPGEPNSKVAGRYGQHQLLGAGSQGCPPS